MQVGLFFGSFNPIHIGHLAIANTVAERGAMDQVWFVVSPQNPFKKSKGLLHEFDRLDMVEKAIYDNPKLRATDIEFHMPRPSYTVDTLVYLGEKHPNHHFSLIIGEDNLTHFHKWKNHEQILEHHALLVYPRPGAEPSPLREHPKVTWVQAPLFDISATYIRKSIKEGHSIRYLVPDAVDELIQRKRFYQD